MVKNGQCGSEGQLTVFSDGATIPQLPELLLSVLLFLRWISGLSLVLKISGRKVVKPMEPQFARHLCWSSYSATSHSFRFPVYYSTPTNSHSVTTSRETYFKSRALFTDFTFTKSSVPAVDTPSSSRLLALSSQLSSSFPVLPARRVVVQFHGS
jgi:hypothetical protein